MSDNTIKLSDFPLQSQLADTDTIILDGKRITAADLFAAVRGSIKIGGRNLLKGSMQPMPNPSGSYKFENGVHSAIMDSGEMGIYKHIGSFPIAEYAISVELKADAPMDVRWYLANNESSAHSWRVTTEWERYTAVLTPTEDSLLFRLTSHNFTTRFYARFPKIEQGNIPTGFSLAPEDLLSASGGGNAQIFSWLRNGERRGAA